MAWEVPGRTISLEAASDLTGQLHRFLSLDANGRVVVANATSVVVGVLYNKPAAGQAASVVVDGVVEVYTGGAVSTGVRVKSDATGRAVAAGGTDLGIGIALRGATAAGRRIPVLLLLTAAVAVSS